MIAATSDRSRVEWVDYAKGICIFFVVMLHVNDLVQNHLHAIGWLERVVRFARPFRMPDFFLIAGLFLPRVIHRPWRLFLDRKVVHFFYFYLLWMTIEFAVLGSRRAFAEGMSTSQVLWAYAGEFVNPDSALWFIHILPLFFLLTRVTRSVPWWAMWTAAVILHSMRLDTGWIVLDQLAARYVYFYSGYALAAHVLRGADWASRHTPIAGVYLLVWALVNGALVRVGVSAVPGISLALGYAGAMAVVVAAVLLSRVQWTSAVRFIGQHSLVIFLADALVSVVAMRIFLPVIPDIGSLALISTIVTITGALVLWQVVLRTPLRFLYVRPAPVRIAPAPALSD